MLLEFSVKNFLSIKDEVIFSLYASDEVRGHEKDNLIPITEQNILKTAVIYGANASGKSNLIKAMGFMKKVILNSLKLNPEEKIMLSQGCFNFQLHPKNANSPLEMEIIFLYQDIYYRYGFALDTNRIHREWLYSAPEENEILLYKRHFKNNSYFYDIPDDFLIPNNFTENNILPANTLLLVVLAKFTDSPPRKVMKWIKNIFNVIFASDEQGYEDFTINKLNDKSYKTDILNFLKVADVGIENVFLESVTMANLPNHLSKRVRKELKNIISSHETKQIIFEHNIFDNEGKIIGKKTWGNNNESAGTLKLFALSGVLIDILRKGKVLIIDELDAKLHPMIMRFILSLFHSQKHNPHNAQLIFASHDTQLLSPRFFRRDQIWFTEKNPYEATELYSLADFDLEDDANFHRDYFQGRYNAVPFIGDLRLFNENKKVKHGKG